MCMYVSNVYYDDLELFFMRYIKVGNLPAHVKIYKQNELESIGIFIWYVWYQIISWHYFWIYLRCK